MKDEYAKEYCCLSARLFVIYVDDPLSRLHSIRQSQPGSFPRMHSTVKLVTLEVRVVQLPTNARMATLRNLALLPCV